MSAGAYDPRGQASRADSQVSRPRDRRRGERPILRGVAVVGALLGLLLTLSITGSAFAAPGDLVVSDRLDRVGSGGWGAATTGGAYVHVGAADFSTGGGYGTVRLPAPAAERRAALAGVRVLDATATISVAVAELPAAGSGTYNSLQLRTADDRAYRATLRIGPGGERFLSLGRYDQAGAGPTPLGGEVKLPESVQAHQWSTLRFEVSGTTPVRLSAKTWMAGQAEPAWQTTFADASSSRLVGSGSPALTTYLSRSSTPTTVFFDTFSVTEGPGSPAPTSSPIPTPPISTPPPPAPSTPAPSTPTPSTPTPSTPPASGPIGTTGSATVGSARYSAPADAVYVAPSGSDVAAGSLNAPLRTLQAAVDKAPVGVTVVLRAGSYVQQATVTKRLTIQNYPGEAVWLDGSTVVSGFVANGATWRRDGWTTHFDASPIYIWGAPDSTEPYWGFVNPAYPMAAHPDQVWINGVAQQQVGDAGAVGPGRFYVDYAAQRLVIGSDPNAGEVRASVLAKPLTLRAEGIVVRGLGVRRYAPSVPHLGAITLERPGISLENVHVDQNATTGISVVAAQGRLTRVTSERNGLLGVHANHADGLSVTDLLARQNNLEHFNSSPVSGGIKITRTRGVSITRSSSLDNLGPGFWLDESVFDGVIARSVAQGNSGHGVSLEISGKMIVAGNLIKNNSGFGVKINNTSEVQLWNNTFVDDNRPINIVQDARRQANPNDAGHDPRRPIPDPTMPWINGPVTVSNNIVSGTNGNCLLCVEDYSHQLTAEQMRVTSNGNVYRRAAASRPTWLAVWSRGAGNPAVYTSLAAFQAATGQEARSLGFDGPAVVNADGTATASINQAAGAVALPLPATIAGWLEQPTSTQHLGIFG